MPSRGCRRSSTGAMSSRWWGWPWRAPWWRRSIPAGAPRGWIRSRRFAMSDPVLVLSGIQRSFEQGGKRLAILRGIDLAIEPGEMVGLVGPSGAGKSTLLHITGLLERPDAGSITIAGANAQALGDGERTRLRREAIGFVYQV